VVVEEEEEEEVVVVVDRKRCQQLKVFWGSKGVMSGGWMLCHCTMFLSLVWSTSGNCKFRRWTGLGLTALTVYEVGCMTGCSSHGRCGWVAGCQGEQRFS
jgi:hypothetical protein